MNIWHGFFTHLEGAHVHGGYYKYFTASITQCEMMFHFICIISYKCFFQFREATPLKYAKSTHKEDNKTWNKRKKERKTEKEREREQVKQTLRNSMMQLGNFPLVCPPEPCQPDSEQAEP